MPPQTNERQNLITLSLIYKINSGKFTANYLAAAADNYSPYFRPKDKTFFLLRRTKTTNHQMPTAVPNGKLSK